MDGVAQVGSPRGRTLREITDENREANVEPQPPEINGPWFLWKLLIDERHQGRGYGFEVVRQIAELVRSEGATEPLTSYVAENGGPGGFYERLGFAPTGELDPDGEVIMRLVLPWRQCARPPSSE